MIRKLIFIFICSLAITTAYSQTQAKLVLKNGDILDIYHLGQANCNGRMFYNGYLMIKGLYNGINTELKDFSKLKSIELVGFTTDPVKTGNNEKATIIVERNNGSVFTLEDAELIMACYGSGEMYNQLKLQVVNPLTDKVDESAFATKDIQKIILLH